MKNAYALVCPNCTSLILREWGPGTYVNVSYCSVPISRREESTVDRYYK